MASDSSNPESLFSTKTPDKTATLPTRSRNSDVSISFPELLKTPETKHRSSQEPNGHIKTVKRQIFSSPPKPEIAEKLPERFEILEKLFNGLDTAIRLLKLKGSLTTFANVCPKIEYLTNRIFSYDHLAQMKHIYPEAIEVKRLLKYDESTSCMKPSLLISLNTETIILDDTNCGTKYMELRKVFHSKLVDFYKAHPKDEVPKELLPEPFNSPKKDGYSDTLSVKLGAPKPKPEVEGFDVHMEEMELEEHIVDKVIPSSVLSTGIVDKVIPDSTLSAGTKECLLSHIEPRIVGTPVKDLSTPSKELSTPIRLMSATPVLQPSRRCIMMTPDYDDDDTVKSTHSLTRRPSRTRCLNFDTLEDHGTVKDGISKKSDDELVDIIKSDDDASNEDNLLQSKKPEPGKHNLPKLVNLIHTLFHSTRRTVITKTELLHKMIASQIDITDRREVEEQLSLLLQLVPDWISETKASSGDYLVRINKLSSVESVRARVDATSQDISTIYSKTLN